MEHSRQALLLTGLVALGSGAMIWVERVLRPAYLEKSIWKLVLFAGCILLGRYLGNAGLGLTKPRRGALLRGTALAAAAFAAILVGYALLSPWLDLSNITSSLEEKEGITAEVFPFVAVYISVVNSFLEELFFRGFAFLGLSGALGRRRAMLLSTLAFAVYHVGILDGWVALWLVALMVAGLFCAGALFNWLDREGSFIPSWLVHIAANLAINAIGMRLFGIW